MSSPDRGALVRGNRPRPAVSAYLRDVDHTSVTDLDYSPFRASYTAHAAERRPSPPAQQGIWEASVNGTGPPDADLGCPGRRLVGGGHERGRVSRRQDRHQRRSQGPFLVAMGWGAIGARAILLAIAGVLALLVIRGQREPSEGREHTGAPRPPSRHDDRRDRPAGQHLVATPTERLPPAMSEIAAASVAAHGR